MKMNPPCNRHLFVTLRGAVVAIALVWGLIHQSAQAQNGQNGRPRSSPNDFRKDSRRAPDLLNRRPVDSPEEVKMGPRTLDVPDEFRTIEGTGNNVMNPEWGSAEIPFLRLTPIAYGDGTDSPSGDDRPNAREVSNAVSSQLSPRYNRNRASDFVWQWGQFLDHDITHTPVADPPEVFDIEVPAGDEYFDPDSNGDVVIPMDRSFYDVTLTTGVREQVNEITAYIDASNVYGSNDALAHELRTNDGTGKMATSEGNLLPFNVNGFPNAPSSQAPNFFLGGDFRVNEQVGLTAMHTLFVREHNYWADVIANSDNELTGDQIYEVARSIVAAEMQIVTYNEFLPMLLGPRALPPYAGYDEELNAGISNVFATASYRFGHSMLSTTLLRLDRRGDEIEEGHLDLAGAFFNPSVITDEGGIDPILRGLATQHAQEVDILVIDDVRNFLFGAPGEGGFDLVSLNIQRGRDHGLPGFNEVREAFGLREVSSISRISRDSRVVERLEEVYDDVDQIDPWVGGLAELPLREGMMGETNAAVLRDQFIRLREGDRFWYQNYLSPEMQELLERQTLATIIRRNTEIGRELQDNVFIASGRPSDTFQSAPDRGGRGQPTGNDRRPRSRDGGR